MEPDYFGTPMPLFRMPPQRHYKGIAGWWHPLCATMRPFIGGKRHSKTPQNKALNLSHIKCSRRNLLIRLRFLPIGPLRQCPTGPSRQGMRLKIR